MHVYINSHAGTYGKNSSNICQPCAQGTYQEMAGQYECFSCPAGFYNNLTSSESLTSCTPCGFGYIGTIEAQISFEYILFSEVLTETTLLVNYVPLVKSVH